MTRIDIDNPAEVLEHARHLQRRNGILERVMHRHDLEHEVMAEEVAQLSAIADIVLGDDEDDE